MVPPFWMAHQLLVLKMQRLSWLDGLSELVLSMEELEGVAINAATVNFIEQFTVQKRSVSLSHCEKIKSALWKLKIYNSSLIGTGTAQSSVGGREAAV